MLLPKFVIYFNCDFANIKNGTLQIAYLAKMRCKSILKNATEILQM